MILKKIFFASVFYKTDMTKQNSEDIVIALILHIIVSKPKASAYILHGKQSLSEKEKENVGFMGRKLLKNPIKYVEKFTDEAFAKNEDFFKYLSKNLSWSIQLSKIEEIQVPIDMRKIFLNLFNDINTNKSAAISRYLFEIHSTNSLKNDIKGIEEFNRALSEMVTQDDIFNRTELTNKIRTYEIVQ